MSGHGVNDRDVSAIVYLVTRLRQDTHGANTWDEIGIHAKVRELLGQNLEITLERVFRHAADPEAKTPGAIHRGFLPPAASEKAPVKRGNPHRDEECPQHPGQWADACTTCKVEVYDPGAVPSPDLVAVEHANPRLAQRLRALAGEESS